MTSNTENYPNNSPRDIQIHHPPQSAPYQQHSTRFGWIRGAWLTTSRVMRGVTFLSDRRRLNLIDNGIIIEEDDEEDIEEDVEEDVEEDEEDEENIENESNSTISRNSDGMTFEDVYGPQSPAPSPRDDSMEEWSDEYSDEGSSDEGSDEDSDEGSDEDSDEDSDEGSDVDSDVDSDEGFVPESGAYFPQNAASEISTISPHSQRVTPITDEENTTESANENDNKDEIETCSVCYKDLAIENSVCTLCDHFYCRKCFFRWIEVNATCAMCRAPIDSKTNLSEEQLSQEYSECYLAYKNLIINNARYWRRNMKLIKEEKVLEEKNISLMNTQIRLRDGIEYSSGYNDGSMAAHDKILGGKGRKDPKFIGKFANNHWSYGFNMGYQTVKEFLKNKLRDINSDKQMREESIESRDSKTNLYNFGFTITKSSNTFAAGTRKNTKLKPKKQKNRKYVIAKRPTQNKPDEMSESDI